MRNPGEYILKDASKNIAFTVTAAATQNGDPVLKLDGMTALSGLVKFDWGSGGTTCKVYVQTSLDQGATWIDIAALAFTTADASKVFNLSGLTPKTTAVVPTDGTLTDDTCLDGILGDRVRLKVVSTGTYAGSTIVTGWIAAR